MSQALLVIDLQNDYFPGGRFPLWNTEGTLERCVLAIKRARALGMHVILVQHIAANSKGLAPFFNPGSDGAALHPRILATAPTAPVIVKSFADSFWKTNLEESLSGLGVSELLICGMMTQNCVTHTAISKAAEKYKVSVLSDCCTTVDEMIHKIALSALSIRVPLMTSNDLL